MLSEGDFEATIIDAFLGFKAFGGESAVILRLGIRDAADQAFKETWEGGFSDDTWTGRTMKALRNAGFVGDDLSTVGEQLIRKKVPVTIRHKFGKEKEDGTRACYLQIFINAKNRMSPEEAKAFADGMRRVVAAAGQADGGDGEALVDQAAGGGVAAAGQVSVGTAAAMALSDDDFPF